MIQFENVYKSYKNKSVLQNISLTVRTGEFMVLIGASGCGKTTLLKMINKLNTIDQGDILLDDVSVTKMNDTKMRRKIGYVVQDGGLFPHMTVAENISIILKVLNVPKKKQEARINELLEMVDLDPDYRNLYPSQLSGGQQHRVGVARAFAADPGIILMDEPFSALDPVVRAELQDEIVRLQKKLNKTILFVTHDMDEAILLADRICIIQNGHIVQCDTPENILKHPANSEVADFVGPRRLWSNPEFIEARDIMKTDPCRISGDRTVLQALQVMNHYAVDSLLVTDKHEIAGIVWLSDLQNFKQYTSSLKDFISTDFVSVYEDTTLKKIVNTIDYNISGIIPVINHKKQLVGYLTKSILLSSLSKQYETTSVSNSRSGII